MATPVRIEGAEASGFSTLVAVTGAATGVTFDPGRVVNSITVISVGTGTLAGTITIEGSLDGTTWVSSGTTVAQTAAGTVTASVTGKPFRFIRASLSGVSGAGTVTTKIVGY